VDDPRDTAAAAGFLGRGWCFPPRFEPSRGAVEMVSREDDIIDSLRSLFVTRPGERVMQPTYGCALHDLVFEPMDSETESAIALAITRAIRFHEARIDQVAVTVDVREALEGRLSVIVAYRIAATNNRQNVVFPLYINEGTLISQPPASLGG